MRRRQSDELPDLSGRDDEGEDGDVFFCAQVLLRHHRHVPCHVCSQCGETLYSASVMDKIDEILERIEKIASKSFFIDYRNAI
jgi:YgiT-type zinc finger domain